MKTQKEIRIENRRAHYDYFVLEQLECGISLRGNEVKSIREGRCNINQAWCTIQNGNLVVRGMHINAWDSANKFDVDEDRERQLLAHKKEIAKLKREVTEDGITLIPLSLYFSRNGKCKLEIGVCKGKHNYDKRKSIKERENERKIRKALKEE